MITLRSLRPSMTAAATIVSLFAVTSIHAAQDAASSAARGRITPLQVQVTDPRLPAGETRKLTAKVSVIIDQVLQTPILDDPRGFSLTRSLKVDAPLSAFAWHPAQAEVVIIAQEIDLSAHPRPDADGAYMGRLEGPSFRIGINNLTALFANVSSRDDAAEGFLTLSLSGTKTRGYPVFRVGVRDVILIAKPGKTPYTMVTKAEYLQFLINEEEALHAQFGAPSSPKAKAYYEGLLAERASLTAEAGQAVACVSSSLRQTFGDCDAKDAAAHVRLNTAYFERGQGQGSVQLVTISTPAEGGHGHPRLEPKFREAAEQLDLDAIAALLD